MFCAPSYWPTWLLLAWMRVAASLPIHVNLELHKFLGRLAGWCLAPRARVARRNLELCFPERAPREIDALLQRHFVALGACLGETAAAWFGRHERLHGMLEVEGREHLEAALEGGRGVLLYTGHFTPLEITGPLLAALTDRFAFMFSRRRNALLDEMQRRGRARASRRFFPRDDIRSLLRGLSENTVVWYAADQVDTSARAALIPFFGVPAMTNTAISRLARLSGASVVPFSFRRRADDSAYVLVFEAPLADFPSEDAAADTRRLVARLEQAIRRAPEQYVWMQKRFRGRPAPWPDAYAEPAFAPPVSRRPHRGWLPLSAAAGVLAVWLSGLYTAARESIDAAARAALASFPGAAAAFDAWFAHVGPDWLDDVATLVVLAVFVFTFLRGRNRDVPEALALCVYTALSVALVVGLAEVLPAPGLKGGAGGFPGVATAALLVVARIWSSVGARRHALVAVALAGAVAVPRLRSGAYGATDLLGGALPLALAVIVLLGTRLGSALRAVSLAAAHAVLAAATRLGRAVAGETADGGSASANLLRGLAIGAAQLVPGLGSGTVALVVGAYQRLVHALARVDAVWLRMLLERRFADALRRLDIVFVLPVAVGVLFAPYVFSRALPLELLVAEMPEMSFGFVFGLIAASIVGLLVGIDERRVVPRVWLAAGVALGCSLALLVPAHTPSGVAFLFLCGAVAAVAMLTPGLSASLALIVLGKYFELLDAFAHGEWSVLLPAAAGAFAGAALFVRIMAWLLERHRQHTMLAVTGVVGGSLLAFWPFQEWVVTEVGGRMHVVGGAPYLPQTLDRGVVMGVVAMLSGVVVFRLIARIARAGAARTQRRIPPRAARGR